MSSEIPGSKEQPNLDKYDLTAFEEAERTNIARAIEYIERWLQMPIEEKSTDDAISIFYGYSEILMLALRANQEPSIMQLMQQFQKQLRIYKEVMDIIYPSTDALTEVSNDDPELSPLDTISLRNEPMLCEIKINQVMAEFEKLGQVLLSMLLKPYDFKILGEDIAETLENAAMQIESLSAVPESKRDTEYYRKLVTYCSVILTALINRRQRIQIESDELTEFISGMASAEEPITDDILQERYAELVAMAVKMLTFLRVDSAKLAEREAKEAELAEFQDMAAVGSVLGPVVEGVVKTVKGTLAKVPGLGKKKAKVEDDDQSTVDTYTSNIREWMETDLEEMWKQEPFIAFCTNMERLLATLEIDSEAINQKFTDKKAELVELLDLRDRGLETQVPEEKLMYKPVMRKVMVEQPHIIQPKIYYVMQELRALAEELLDEIEGKERKEVYDFEFLGSGIRAEDFERIIGRIEGLAGYSRKSINRYTLGDLEDWTSNLFINIRDRIWNNKELHRFYEEMERAREERIMERSFAKQIEAADKMMALFRVSKEELARREAERARLATDLSLDS